MSDEDKEEGELQQEEEEINDDDDDKSSTTSSLCTERLLSLDPMYIRLTKFLYTSDNKRNITEVLEGIEKKLELLITLFSK